MEKSRILKDSYCITVVKVLRQRNAALLREYTHTHTKAKRKFTIVPIV
jgi:hypothetical protein